MFLFQQVYITLIRYDYYTHTALFLRHRYQIKSESVQVYESK